MPIYGGLADRHPVDLAQGGDQRVLEGSTVHQREACLARGCFWIAQSLAFPVKGS